MKRNFFNSTTCLVLGILLFLIGCIQPIRREFALEDGYEVTATITEVKERDEHDAESGYVSTSYTVYVDYEFEGTEYKHVKIGKYYNTDQYYVGKTVTVVVNPNNPGKLLTEGGILSMVGFLFAIGAVIVKIKAQKNRQPPSH